MLHRDTSSCMSCCICQSKSPSLGDDGGRSATVLGGVRSRRRPSHPVLRRWRRSSCWGDAAATAAWSAVPPASKTSSAPPSAGWRRAGDNRSARRPEPDRIEPPLSVGGRGGAAALGRAGLTGRATRHARAIRTKVLKSTSSRGSAVPILLLLGRLLLLLCWCSRLSCQLGVGDRPSKLPGAATAAVSVW